MVNFKHFFTLIQESTNVMLKFFHGAKALLDDGDNFIIVKDDSFHKSFGFRFIYKGTRLIEIWLAGFSYGGNELKNITVVVFEIHKNNDREIPEKLDTNVFYNKEANKTYQLSYDPVITNPPNMVSYIKAVLDRDDRDKDPESPPKDESPKGIGIKTVNKPKKELQLLNK